MTNPYDLHTAADAAAIQLPICHKVVNHDISGDFSLPDYQPEIKRLLRIGTSILPPERYATRDSLELNGTMDYFVLYTGNDDQLYCAPLTTDYQINVPLGEERDRNGGVPSLWSGEDVTCTCDIAADPVTGRVTAPRRLNIKCRLNARVKAYAHTPMSVSEGDTTLNDHAERLTSHIRSSRLLRGVGEILPLQDDVILSPAEGNEVRVVCAEGQVMVTEASAGQGMITCRGDVLLKLTLCPADIPEGEESLPTITVRKIPFSQAVEVPDVTPDCSSCAHGACSEMSIEIEEGHLHADLGIVLEVLAQKNQITPYTKDLYSTQRETTCQYATYPTEEAIKCLNGNFTLSDSLPLSEAGISPSSRVADVTATAFPESITSSRGKCILSGRCRVHMLLLRDGEYGNAEFELPFRYESDSGMNENDTAEDASPALDYDACVQVVTCRARMDGERVGIDAELAVMMRTVKAGSMMALSEVALGEEVTRRLGEYVICFPAPNDTLWTVAKRYHAPLAALSAANTLTPAASAAPDAEDSLEGIGYLIV